MGGQNSGRRPAFKTQLVLFGMDVQMKATEILDQIKNNNATFDEVSEKLVELIREARRICEENERL